jgi:hypothetical protein
MWDDLLTTVSPGFRAESKQTVETRIPQPQATQENMRHRQLKADCRVEGDGAGRAVSPGVSRQEHGEFFDPIPDLWMRSDRRSDMKEHCRLGKRLIRTEASFRFLIVAIPVFSEECNRARRNSQSQAHSAHQVFLRPRSNVA